MRKTLSTCAGIYGLLALMWPGPLTAQPLGPPQPPFAPALNAAPPPPGGSTRYVPLGQVLPRATQESGVQIQAPPPILKEQVPVRESGPDRNLNLEPVLDEFSRIELFGGNSELRKVIILNRNTGAVSQAPSSIPPSRSPVARRDLSHSAPDQKPVTRAARLKLPETNLTQQQLKTLIQGAYRSPLQAQLWDDPVYRKFLAGQGITSRDDMNDRKKAKNLRKMVRRLLWQMR